MEGFFEVAGHSLNLPFVPASQKAVHFGEENAKAVPKLRLLLGYRSLLSAQIYVFGEFEEKHSEANHRKGPNILNDIEYRGS
jgi:hypothetical protein